MSEYYCCWVTDSVYLVNGGGGSPPHEGNVYALNPTTGVLGPVCDDSWDIRDVKTFIFNDPWFPRNDFSV